MKDLDQKIVDALSCSNYPSKGNVFASNGVAEGSAATADIYIYGYILA